MNEEGDRCVVCSKESHWGVIYKKGDDIEHEHFCDSCYQGIKRKTIKWPK